MSDGEELSKKIWAFLPTAIKRVVHSYNQFSVQYVEADAKAFSTHHAACKSALQHLEALLKIMKSSPLTKDSHHEEEMLDLTVLVEQAKLSLEQLED